jgi:branched-chain amino acid transport system substrate-binding protein
MNMKTFNVILIILVFLGFSSCKDNNENFFPEQIGMVISNLSASFDTLNTAMAAGATAIAPDPSDTAMIRNKMSELYTNSSFSENFSFIDEEGILTIIEPSEFHSFEGSDLSLQEHVIRAWETLEPVLSEEFYAVEGYYADVDLHPIVNNGVLEGAVSTLFKPEDILGRIILPYVTGQAFEMWVMEKGGVVLYDQDAEEIGRNVFTDPSYQSFPELISAAQLMDSEKSGQTTYSYYQTGTTTKVVKKTYWDTWEMYGTEWKIIWVKPE